MRRKVLALAIGIVCLVGFTAQGAFSAEYTMKFANCVSKDHSWGRGAEMFKKYLEEASNGKIEVQVYHAASLGKNREVLEMLRMGTVDFMDAGTGHVTNYVPELGILVLPYLWKDSDTMYAALDGPFGADLGQRLAAKGLVLMGWWDNGFRHISNNIRPINSVDDMKGIKIRCLPAKVHADFFKALGAAPTPMGWAELYQALQQGVVDAQENPPAMTYFAKFYEVQKYYSLTAHANEPGLMLMSQKSLDKLPKDLQLAVKVAAHKATMWQRAANMKDNDEALKKLEESPMKVNPVSDETIAKFREIAFSVYPESIKDFGPDGKELVDLMVFYNK